MSEQNFCPVCGKLFDFGLEYAYGSPARYDGVSEWQCIEGHRWGRWSGRVLYDGDVEWPHGIERKKQ